MTKTKKSSKKSKFNPADFERRLLVFLLVALVASSAVLLMRSQNVNNRIELGEPSAVIERQE